MKRFRSTLLFCCLVFVIGCGFWSVRNTEGPGINKWDYKETCGSCHDAPKPREKTDEQWQEFILQHRFIAGQDRETAQLFADYLKQRN